MKRFTPLIAILCLLFGVCASASAAPAVGDDAPALDGFNWVLHNPFGDSLEHVGGDVVVVLRWGVLSQPCLALIPQLSAMHNQYAAKGLHLFAIESSNADKSRIEPLMVARKATYPVSAGGASAYAGSVGTAWVIGADGTVAWTGQASARDFGSAVKRALKDVEYPGLGKAEVDSEVRKAAKYYGKGEFDKARKEAQKVLDGDELEDAARADAEYIVERIEEAAARRLAAAKSAEGTRHYQRAATLYEWIEDHFGRDDEGRAAKDRLREMSRDNTIKREIEADKAWLELCQMAPSAGSMAAYQQFMAKYKGTRVVEELESR